MALEKKEKKLSLKNTHKGSDVLLRMRPRLVTTVVTHPQSLRLAAFNVLMIEGTKAPFCD